MANARISGYRPGLVDLAKGRTLSRWAPVVATLHWYRKYDRDRQLVWLQRSQATAAGIDCSTLYGARRWREVLSAIAYIRAVMPELELHVWGASSADRLRDLANFELCVYRRGE